MLRSSAVVFVCLSDDKKVFWTFIVAGSIGASGAVSSAWSDLLLVALMSFSMVLCRCSSLLLAIISWSAVIHTLATNRSLNFWVSNMVSSSNTVVCSSKLLNPPVQTGNSWHAYSLRGQIYFSIHGDQQKINSAPCHTLCLHRLASGIHTRLSFLLQNIMCRRR